MANVTRVTGASLCSAVLMAACSASPDVGTSAAARPTETAQPTATPTPRPTVRPRATTRPTPTPVPREEIALVDFGFTTFQGEFDDGANLNYALILENPNPDWLATRLSVNVSFLDEAGSVVTTASETVALILPGKQVAVTGTDSYFSNPDLASITEMQVQMSSPDWEEPDGPVGEFQVSDIATRAGEFGQLTTTAQITSTFAEEIESPQAVVVYFDSAGAIVGGDFTYVDFVPAGGTVPIEISGFGELPGVSSSDVFITFSFISF